jgi:hypothetical protein
VTQRHPGTERREKVWRFATCLVVVAVGFVLAGCSSAEQQVQPELIGPDNYQQEYEMAVANFPEPMPSNISFPASPAPLKGLAEASVGEAQAYFIWACAWQDTLLNSDDPVAEKKAAEQIGKFSSTSWAELHYQDPEGVWKKMAEKATLGDVSEVRASFDGDCIYYREARNGN